MTPPAETTARDALRASVHTNQQQQALTEESRLLLADMLENRMRIAVAEGIAESMTDENAARFCRAVLSEAQKMASEKTGQMVGGAVMALVKRGLLFVFLGSIVYAIGGWSALAGLAKFLAGDK